MDYHDVLDVESIARTGPYRKQDGAIEDARNGEGEVVVAEEVRPYPQEENARNRSKENADCGG